MVSVRFGAVPVKVSVWQLAALSSLAKRDGIRRRYEPYPPSRMRLRVSLTGLQSLPHGSGQIRVVEHRRTLQSLYKRHNLTFLRETNLMADGTDA